MEEVGEAQRDIEKPLTTLDHIRNIMSGIGGVLSIIFNVAKATWNKLLKPLGSWLGKHVLTPALEYLGGIGLKIREIADRWNADGTIEKTFGALADRFKLMGERAKVFWQVVRNLPGVTRLTSHLQAAWAKITDVFNSVKSGTVNKFNEFLCHINHSKGLDIDYL